MVNITYVDKEDNVDPGEVSQVRWIAPEDFRTEIEKHPERFSEGRKTAWASLCSAHPTKPQRDPH
jgi:isopentenyldiphosphate isomerase